MPNKFNKGDKVVKKGTSHPVMLIEGNAVITSFPNYKTDTENYVCNWQSEIDKERQTIHEDELELYDE